MIKGRNHWFSIGQHTNLGIPSSIRRVTRCVACKSRPKSAGSESNQASTPIPSVHSPQRMPEDAGRLFSNLDPQLNHQPGTVWGAAVLVAGTTVGAGILALPAVTQESGFVASSTALLGCWVYAVVTGLLVAEVNINTMCALGGSGVSLNSMAKRTLGPWGTIISTGALVLLQYALLVAYTAKGAEVMSLTLGLPLPVCGISFVALFAGLCYALTPSLLDVANSILLAAVIFTFTGLVAAAAPFVQADALLEANWQHVPQALPVMALAFVYQNVVPSIASTLEGDVAKIRTSILLGSSIPLLMFLLWDAAILGSAASLQQVHVATEGAVFDPLAALRASNGVVAPLVDAFSFFAIATSYIGFVISLNDFFADTLELPVGAKQPLPYALTVLPPLALALLFPDLFFSALDFAGTYGVLVLFGMLPALMVYSERYAGTTLTRYQLVPGGITMLLVVGGTAAAIIVNEAAQLLSSL